jgi:hypothetical protein
MAWESDPNDCCRFIASLVMPEHYVALGPAAMTTASARSRWAFGGGPYRHRKQEEQSYVKY